jgi:hypothetical protein
VPQVPFAKVKRSARVYDLNMDRCFFGGPMRLFY